MSNVLIEESVIGSVNVTASGAVEVRTDTFIRRDDIVIAGPVYHRHVLAPGDAIEGEDARVVAVANAVWTPDVVAAHRARIAARSGSQAAAAVVEKAT